MLFVPFPYPINFIRFSYIQLPAYPFFPFIYANCFLFFFGTTFNCLNFVMCVEHFMLFLGINRS